MCTFRDGDKNFELRGGLLKMKTIKIYYVYITSLLDKKLMYDFAKELYFFVKAPGNKPTWVRLHIRLLQSSSIKISASNVSKTIFLSSDPNYLCDRLKFLLQEKQAGNNSDTVDGEKIALADKMVKYRCISRK